MLAEFAYRFLIGAAGAGAFEALKLWELRAKLPESRFRALFRSYSMWVPLILMLAASGFLCWALYEGEPNVRAWKLVTAGITTRTLLRELSSVASANKKVKLGSSSSALTDYFS
jgi:hypothetical protein